MGDLIPSSINTERFKSFWSKTEGKVGMVFLAILGTLGVYKLLPYADRIMSHLLSIAQNGFLLAMYLVGLFALFMLVTSRTVRTLIGGLFQASMYHLTNLFIAIDPVGIAKGTLNKLGEIIEKLAGKRKMIAGKNECAQQEKTKIEDEITTRDDDRNRMAKAAAKAKQEAEARGARIDLSKFTGPMLVEDNQIKRLRIYLKDITPVCVMMEDLYMKLGKIENYTRIRYADLQNQTDLQIRKRSFMKDMKSAIDSARAILQGGDVKKLYDQSMERMMEEFNQDMGEVKSFMEDISPLLDRVDMDNAMAVTEALEKIDKFLDAKSDVIEIEYQEPIRLPLPGKKEADYAAIVARKK